MTKSAEDSVVSWFYRRVRDFTYPDGRVDIAGMRHEAAEVFDGSGIPQEEIELLIVELAEDQKGAG